MSRLGLLCLCVCAVSSLAYGRAVRRGERPAESKLRHATDKPEPYDSFIPGQCRVNGMSLFDGAMWSTQPCSLCQCRRGIVSCQAVPCGGSNNQQSRAPKAKRLDDSKVDKDDTPEQRSGLQSNGGTRVQEVKKIPAAPLPSSVRDKPMAAKKKKQDSQRDRTAVKRVAVPVVVKMPVRAPAVPAARTPTFIFPESHEDDFDDDDDDDDVVGPPPRVQVTDRPTLRPIPKPGVTMARTPIPVPVAPGRPVVTFPQTPSFMESLPAGCLLSDSLIACGSTGMTHMPIIKDQGVRTLYLADNRISKIPARALAGLPNLEWLDLSKNKLTDASISPMLFQNLTKLRRLILDGNNLTKVPMFLPASLVELKINDNKLSGLTPSSFKGLSKLLTLELEDNHFHDGNVSPLTFRPLRKLMYLRLEDNKFRAVPSGLPTSLQALHLSDNKIEVVHAGILNKTLNLRVLDLSHNRIREDRIAPRAWIHLLKLESLDLSHNKLVHVPSFLPSGVRQLTLHHNQIERIPGYVFAHLHPGLDSLHLSHNRLRDDGIDNVSFMGLSASLSELLLDHNQLRSIPRGLLQLKNLQHLRLNHNLISYVPMNALCDTHATEDSPLISVHLQYNLIQRRLIPPTAFSCIRNYHSVLLRPQNHDDYDE